MVSEKPMGCRDGVQNASMPWWCRKNQWDAVMVSEKPMGCRDGVQNASMPWWCRKNQWDAVMVSEKPRGCRDGVQNNASMLWWCRKHQWDAVMVSKTTLRCQECSNANLIIWQSTGCARLLAGTLEWPRVWCRDEVSQDLCIAGQPFLDECEADVFADRSHQFCLIEENPEVFFWERAGEVDLGNRGRRNLNGHLWALWEPERCLATDFAGGNRPRLDHARG